jgi:hypothetical protein
MIGNSWPPARSTGGMRHVRLIRRDMKKTGGSGVYIVGRRGNENEEVISNGQR